MSEIIQLDDLLKEKDARFLEKTTLTTRGNGKQVPIFGRHTLKLAREIYGIACKQHPDKLKMSQFDGQSGKREEVLCDVEHGAQLGALLRTMQGEDTIVYDVGCGIAIPSFSYLRLDGDYVFINDRSEYAMQRSLKWAANLRVRGSLDSYLGRVEDILPENPPLEQDIILVSNPVKGQSLYEYVSTISLEYPSTLVVSVAFEELHRGMSDILGRISKLADDYKHKYLPGREVQILIGKRPENEVVFIARKS